MSEYNLGTARGKITIEYEGADGARQAERDLRRIEGTARETGGGLADVGTKSQVAGAAIAGGLGYATKVAMDFEKQISAIGAVSGATDAELEILRKKAMQLGADTSFSASEAALAMEELAKAGIPIEGILNGAADATVALAAAGGVELPAAAELAADAMNSFALKSQDLPKIADLIAGAANSSSISVGDFGQSLKQVGAVANLAGISFEDTATAIALMGKMGIKGSDAGTSLKTMLSNLQPTTKAQINLFRDLGLMTKDGSNAFYDAKGNAKGLAEISGILNTATKDLTAQEKQMALETIFGSDAIRAAAVLTKEGKAGFEGMAGAMGKVTAEAVAAKRLDNTAGELEKMKGSAETAAIAFGTLLLPALTKIFKALGSFADYLNGLSPGTKELIVNTALIVAGILLLAGTIIKIAQFAKAIHGVVTAVKAWKLWAGLAKAATAVWRAAQVALNAALTAARWAWQAAQLALYRAKVVAMSAASKAAAAGQWLLNAAIAGANWAAQTAKLVAFKAVQLAIAAATKVWAGVQWLLNVAMMANPIGLIILAIMALIAIIVLIATKTTWFQDLWKIIWDAIKSAAKAVGDWFMNTLVPLFKKAWDLIWAGIKLVIDFVIGYFNFWLSIVKTVFNAVWTAIKWVIDKIVGIFNFWLSVVKKVWNAVVDAIKWAIQKVKDAIEGIKTIIGRVTEFFGKVKDAISSKLGDAVNFVKGIPGKVMSALGNLGSLLYNKGRDIVQGLIDGIKNMFGSLRNVAGDLVGMVTDFLPGSPAKEGPLSGRGYVLKRGQRFVGDFATGILSTARLAKDAMSSMMDGAVTDLPVNTAGTVAAAQSGMSSVTVAPIIQPAQGGGNSRTVTIGTLKIDGTWDMSNPNVPRQFVAKLHEALDDYVKEHR